MSNEEKLKFTKTITNLENENPQQTTEYIKRQKIKETLIKEFNLSEKEAEEKLMELEGKSWNKPEEQSHKNENDNFNKQKATISPPENYPYTETITPQHVSDRQKTEAKAKTPTQPIDIHPVEQQPPQQEKISPEEEYLNDFPVQDAPKKAKKSRLSNLFSKNKKDDEIKEDLEPPKIESNSQDIDAILGDIVPNYSQDVSIELKDVNLSFVVYDDQIDNLKEQIIRTIKRNKSKASTVHVLKDISFKIYQGEKVGIIGYNAAGKSTLLKLIVGIYKPDSGSVIANGNISPLLTLGAGFDNNFSGAKNIYLNGAILGYDREFIEERYDEIVEFADIGESINYPIRNYSSGMKAKLGFSIATIVDPDILIIDEILGVGDINFKRKSRDKMKSLMGGKTTVLLVSHSLGQIREICDKAIWIDNGRIREIGEVNEVCDHYMKDSKKATKEQLKNLQFD